MRRGTRRLTRAVDAIVYFNEDGRVGEATPRLVLVRPRTGSQGVVSVFAVHQLTKEMLELQPEDTQNDLVRSDELLDGDDWLDARNQVVDLALELPDFQPSEFDTSTAAKLLDELIQKVAELRTQLQVVEERAANIDSEEALRYLEPASSLTLHRRTGLYLGIVDGRSVIGLPSHDPDSRNLIPNMALFDRITTEPTDQPEPDFKFTTAKGEDVIVTVKSVWPVRHTKALRPRQMAAAIAALEARHAGEHVAGRYASVASLLGIPREEPVIVQRLISSVVKLLLKQDTADLIAFLAPPDVNITELAANVRASQPQKRKAKRKN
jgi:hypothetical protein